MSKAQLIRKRALDLVRDQDWPNAIKEYRRLVELDQNNPNVHNELADLYLRTNQKNEAFDAFVRAVDEYVRVGLHNNAVAVCKKVLRVLPARHEVLVKLGYIRSRQGLAKEAESYYAQFFEKAAAGVFTAEVFQKLAKPIADDVADSAPMLERLSQAFIAHGLSDDAADVLVKVVALCEKSHDSSGSERARAAVEKLGLAAKLAALNAAPGRDAQTVITEDNLWTKSHTEGERIQVDTTSRTTPTGSPAAPAPQPAGAAPGGPSERDLYLLRLARGSAEARPKKAAEPAPEPVPAAPAASAEVATTPASESLDAVAVAEPEISEANPKPAQPTPRPAAGSNGTGLHVSALMGDDEGASDSETDYRSHYDLGMAYIEMDLFSEAIREYQVAAKSPQYQVKCLEMIGLCFIKQNQPQLAIRQLTKGLSLIDRDSEDSLGIKYNLGLAHEMIGDLGNARTYFEDVYVVDVTFRDVSDKVRKLAETP
ncbi:MAG TPA: tetratricopeptide repeat protein [Candidatus Krumholzibacteria bacterium]